MKIASDISFTELKLLFKSNHSKALNAFYESQRESFFSWAGRKFKLDDNLAADIYQDAIIVLYNAVIENKVDHVLSTPQAYLFGIARNMLFKRTERDKKMQYVDEFKDYAFGGVNDDIQQMYENEEVKSKIASALNKLKDGCQMIIKLFYYHRYTTEAIAERLGYDNTDVVKSRKYQCMKELKKLFN